jgi:uncharacterized protein YjiS (DUF1127 family)
MLHSTAQTIPVHRNRALRIWTVLSGLVARRRERIQLASLDPHLLRDIGLAAEAAEEECAKPFWRS